MAATALADDKAIGLTPGFEKGRCSLCGREGEVRLLVEGGRVARICRDCATKSTMSATELLEKYGTGLVRESS